MIQCLKEPNLSVTLERTYGDTMTNLQIRKEDAATQSLQIVSEVVLDEDMLYNLNQIIQGRLLDILQNKLKQEMGK